MKINLLALLLFSVTYSCASAQTQFAANDKVSRFENKLDFSRPATDNGNHMTSRRRYATNANRPGVVQIGLGWGMVLGGSHLTVDYIDTSEKARGVGITNNFGLRMQVGVTEGFSAGFFLRKDMGSYIGQKGYDKFSLSGVSFGFEGKIYFINKDKFAVYVAPSVGYSFANSSISFDDGSDSVYTVRRHPGKGVGLNYGLTAGLNWYWTDNLGMSCDLGYVGSSSVGVFNSINLSSLSYIMSYRGLYFGVGLVAKFGGG